jgi:hypothetical protein
MVAGNATKREATAKAWVNAGKVATVEEYYAQVEGTPVVEEKPKTTRSTRSTRASRRKN